MKRAWIALALAAVPAIARAYPPPSEDCPPGSYGAIGGFCVPATCSAREECTSTCDAETDPIARAHCAITQACVEEEMCLEEVPLMSAGPYPTTRIVDSCASMIDPEHGTCRCALRGVCRASTGRAVTAYGSACALPLVLAALLLVMRKSRRPAR